MSADSRQVIKHNTAMCLKRHPAVGVSVQATEYLHLCVRVHSVLQSEDDEGNNCFI